MAKLFTIINNKGGTGKTTTAVNLGAALAGMGRRVLLIDLDSQCNLTTAIASLDSDKHVGTLLLKQHNAHDAIVYAEDNGLYLLPSSDKLLDYETQISSEPGREYLLQEALAEVSSQFDYIFIDCPPSLGTLSINALVASDYFIVPMQAENFAFIGLDKILEITDKVKKRMNRELTLAGILFVRLSHKTKFSQAVITNITSNERLRNKLFSTYIRQDIALMEASAFSKTIYNYSPKSRGATDYQTLAKEIIENYG